MARFVTFQHERGEQVLVNADHVVMVVEHDDVSTLMLSNTENVVVRGTLQDVQRLLHSEDTESSGPFREPPGP
jgi:hypothetical protein